MPMQRAMTIAAKRIISPGLSSIREKKPEVSSAETAVIFPDPYRNA